MPVWPRFSRDVLVLALTLFVVVFTSACFTIILEERQPENITATKVPARVDAVTALDTHFMATKTVLVPTAIPQPLAEYSLTINGMTAVETLLTLANGKIQLSPAPNSPDGTYLAGEEVRLTALAEEGYDFSSWEGDCSSETNVCVVILDQDKDLIAEFTLQKQALTLDLESTTEGGNLQVSPSPQVPNGKYSNGTDMELKAVDDEGLNSVGLDGVCSGDSAECQVVTDGDESVEASFTPEFFILTINQVPVKGQHVTVGQGGIAVTPGLMPPAAGYIPGSKVSLVANPEAEDALVHWGGDCAYVAPGSTECVLTMNEDKSVLVEFAGSLPDGS